MSEFYSTHIHTIHTFFNSREVNSNLNVVPTQTVGGFGCTLCVLLRKMAAIQLSLNTALPSGACDDVSVNLCDQLSCSDR